MRYTKPYSMLAIIITLRYYNTQSGRRSGDWCWNNNHQLYELLSFRFIFGFITEKKQGS